MREQAGRLLGAILGAALEDVADARVDLAAAAKRESLVRGAAEEVVAEEEAVVRAALDEVGEPLPALEVVDVVLLADEDLAHQA